MPKNLFCAIISIVTQGNVRVCPTATTNLIIFYRELAEWSKAHDWKSCERVTVPRVQIPHSLPRRHTQKERTNYSESVCFLCFTFIPILYLLCFGCKIQITSFSKSSSSVSKFNISTSSSFTKLSSSKSLLSLCEVSVWFSTDSSLIESS